MNSGKKEIKKNKTSPVKDKILDTTIELISRDGYRKTSARKIARESKISVGTLYHHFKEGKLSILQEIAKRQLKYLESKPFLEINYETIEDSLKALLLENLDMHRKMKGFISALEIEILSNFDYFLERKDLFANEQIQFSKQIKRQIEKFLENGNLSERDLTYILLIVDLLTHRHIIYRNIFGSDEDFVNLLIKLILAILNKD